MNLHVREQTQPGQPGTKFLIQLQRSSALVMRPGIRESSSSKWLLWAGAMLCHVSMLCHGICYFYTYVIATLKSKAELKIL